MSVEWCIHDNPLAECQACIFAGTKPDPAPPVLHPFKALTADAALCGLCYRVRADHFIPPARAQEGPTVKCCAVEGHAPGDHAEAEAEGPTVKSDTHAFVRCADSKDSCSVYGVGPEPCHKPGCSKPESDPIHDHRVKSETHAFVGCETPTPGHPHTECHFWTDDRLQCGKPASDPCHMVYGVRLGPAPIREGRNRKPFPGLSEGGDGDADDGETEGSEPAEEPEPKVLQYLIWLCSLCVAGAGGECHSPGCAMFLNRAPDIPLTEPMTTLYAHDKDGPR